MSSLPLQHDGITYRLAAESDAEDVVQLVLTEFFPRTPMLQNPPADADPQAVRSFVQQVLQHQVSLVAVDTVSGQLVGARLNSIDSDADGDGIMVAEPTQQQLTRYRRFHQVMKFIQLLESNVDCFKMFNVDRAMQFRKVVVLKSFGRRGIGKRLNQLTFDLAASLGIQLVKGSTEMLYSQRINESLGMQAVKRLSFKDYVDPDTGERPFAELDATVHKEAVMFAKLIT